MSMNQAAYCINDQLVARERFYQVACDPQRSVVVEACAGAGKTWMLVSRILRALLDGVPASQILAITFTRKAAGEMRERLHDWLRTFSQADATERHKQLVMRGMTPAQALQASDALAGLYRQWLDDGRGVEIHTIHGWFSRLVRAAPLDALAELGLPPQLNLIEDTSELWPELWGQFLRRMDTQREGLQTPQSQDSERDVFLSLVRELGRFNVEAWLQSALSNRLEITLADEVGHLDESVTPAEMEQPQEALLQESVRAQWWDLAKLLGQAKGAKARAAGVAIEQALGSESLDAQYQGLKGALFTEKGEPRKQLGELPELSWAQAWMTDLMRACDQAHAHQLHRHMCVLSRALFAEYADLKSKRGQVDMVDLELAASHLLSDSSVAGWIQERLDTQVRQLLMDEFQDTSPLQWQTMKSWLASYVGAGGGLSGQQGVKVFLVGDPKQSIYRFRRADPRVFDAAQQFVVDGLGGDLLACDHTHRNAPGVIETLNVVMAQASAGGAFHGFRPHTTESTAVSKVSVLPDVLRPSTPKGAQSEGETQWRDSLLVRREEPESSLKQREAAHVAQAIAELIRDQNIQAEEIFVLSRKRANLAWVAQALQAQGIAHVAPEVTRLMDTAEAQDLVALVEALVSPQHDLALAHALRSPVFGVTDAMLMALARRAQSESVSWWKALMTWAEADAELLYAAEHLRQWAALAKTVPTHDLLEAVLTQGSVRERWVARVPPEMRAQSLSHIHALLAHSLELDGGRNATPYRWIRALKRSPLTLPGRVHPGAVQLLTIHGAKGLEAKVVFIVDADSQEGKSSSYTVMVDWPESANRPASCAFIRSQANPPPSLERAMEHERAAERREELNALYVALTRAREQLVFSRTEPRSSNKHGSWWQWLMQSNAIGVDHAWTPSTAALEAKESDPIQAQVATLPVLPSLSHPPRAFAEKAMTPSSQAASLGQLVHKALEWLTMVDARHRSALKIHQAVQSACGAVNAGPELLGPAQELVTKILHSQELAPWFDGENLLWAGNEVGLIHGGRTLRIDRLVAQPTPEGRVWWVLDYKLNHRPQDLPSYQAQMLQYVEAVQALQPGEQVRSAFITGDGRLIEL